MALTETAGGVTEARLAYASARNRLYLHSLLVGAFKRSTLTQEEVSRRSGIPLAQVRSALLRPRNMDIDLFSRLLFVMTGATMIVAEEFPRHEPSLSPAEALGR